MAASKESSVTNPVPEDIWMMRPCEIYLEEYTDCTSYKGRFHQYYIHGSYTDCERWKEDYKNCLQFRKTGDGAAAECIIANEKDRRAARLEGARGNNVWEYRQSPPADWNSPMPDWTKERQESVLAKAQDQKDSTGTLSSPDSSRCVIS